MHHRRINGRLGAFVVIALMAILAGSPAMAGRMVVRDAPHTDRPGGDFRHTALPAADPELCVSQCAFDQHCVSYTYVRPGVQGAKAMCWLKNTLPPKVVSACCESGHMRYVADRPPQRPARLNPPESPNKESCSIGLICANRQHGRWMEEMQTCDCPAPK